MNTIKCPALVGLPEGSGSHLAPFFVRQITEEEEEKLKIYADEFATNKNRFKLFVMVDRNYAEWHNYTLSLLKPVDGLVDEEMNELDRLLMNFLGSARSLLDHFRKYYVQEHRNTPELNKYDQFISLLESECWAFAFFQDLRNFSQHCGLPVGRYTRTASRHQITLEVVADAKWLLEHSNPKRDWAASKLTEDKRDLDLLDLTREYQVRLLRDFGCFVAGVFAPKLLEAHTFFAGLAEEVQAKHPGKRIAILDAHSIEGNLSSASYRHPPSNLFRSLGITAG